MNYREKNKIIEQICKGKSLFIKDTGITVEVEYFGSDMREFNRNEKEELFCQVTLTGIPTNKALSFFEKFNIKRNSVSNEMELDGVIKLTNLSITPFETKAAKVLYGKNKSK